MNDFQIIGCANPREQFRHQSSAITAAIQSVLESDSYILGNEVATFEREFAEFIGTDYCVGVNSGTDALILSLKALGINSGDEVLTPSHTAVATIAAIIAVGGIPIFVDILEDYYTIDIENAQSKVSKKTRALIVVHIYGQPCKMDSIMKFVKLNDLWLIEDCAQAHGAEFRGKKVGTFGHLSCFSFYPTKNLGAIGDSGAVVTNDHELYLKVERSRQYGWDEQKNIEIFGTVSRMDEIQASILRIKLRELQSSNNRRIDLATKYNSSLHGLGIILPKQEPLDKHVYHLFVIRAQNRDLLIDRLFKVGINLGIHYKKPAHEYYLDIYPEAKMNINLPITNKISKEIVSLPMYPELQAEQIDYVCEQIVMHNS